MQVPKITLNIVIKETFFLNQRISGHMTNLQAIEEPLGKGALPSCDSRRLKNRNTGEKIP